MAQTFTSSATSINRSKLPAVYSKATLTAPMLLDYGCGKYIDHIREHVLSLHKTYLPYDPFNQPKEENASTATLVLIFLISGLYSGSKAVSSAAARLTGYVSFFI